MNGDDDRRTSTDANRYERVVFLGGPHDGDEGADDRRLPELVEAEEWPSQRLAVYKRTETVDSVGRRIYTYRGSE